MEGYIKLNRQVMSWEWYTDNNTFKIFIHCLLKANHKKAKWRGILIERGCFISSYSNLAKETGLTVRQVRTALNHLQMTGEVTKSKKSKYTLFKVSNYSRYQTSDKVTAKQNDKQGDKLATRLRQGCDKVVTTNKNDKNDKNDKKSKRESVREKKNHYGQRENVFLTPFELDSLKIESPDRWLEYIEKLSLYKGSTGKTYESDFCVIKRWMLEDGVIDE